MKHVFFNTLNLCVALLLLASTAVRAQIQESPLDTQILPTGQMFSLIIKGDGESDPPARITAEGLPAESVFLRNLDGSRTFMWIPDEDDVGTNSFLVTIADGSDEQISATYPINLEVIDTTAEKPEILANAQSSTKAQSSTNAQGSASVQNANSANTESKDLAQSTEQHAEQSTADVDAAETQPIAVNATDTSNEQPIKATAAPELPTATVVDVETSAAATNSTTTDATTTDTSTADSDAMGADAEQASETKELIYPVLLLPQDVTVSVNNELTVPIRHSSDTGNSTRLSALNLPQGARLSETPTGHVLVWTPTSRDTGSTAVIITATDSGNASLSTTRRLGIDVIH